MIDIDKLALCDEDVLMGDHRCITCAEKTYYWDEMFDPSTYNSVRVPRCVVCMVTRGRRCQKCANNVSGEDMVKVCQSKTVCVDPAAGKKLLGEVYCVVCANTMYNIQTVCGFKRTAARRHPPSNMVNLIWGKIRAKTGLTVLLFAQAGLDPEAAGGLTAKIFHILVKQEIIDTAPTCERAQYACIPADQYRLKGCLNVIASCVRILRERSTRANPPQQTIGAFSWMKGAWSCDINQ